MLLVQRLQKQVEWLLEQVKCLRDEKCCQHADVALDYDPLSDILSVTFASGVTLTTLIEVPEYTSDLINDGSDGSDLYVQFGDLYFGNAIINNLAGVEYLQTGLDFRVWGSSYRIDGVTYIDDYIEGNVTLSDAHPTDDRIDTFILLDYTPSTATLTLTGGGGGNTIDTITVAGEDILGAPVAFNTDLATTATDIVTQLNTYAIANDLPYNASNTAEVITVTDRTGEEINGTVFTYTASGILASATNFANGDDDVKTVGVLTGIPELVPFKPVTVPTNEVEVSFVEVDALTTDFVGGNTNIVIYDENLGILGGEWDYNGINLGDDPDYGLITNVGTIAWFAEEMAGASSTFTTFNGPPAEILYNTNGTLYMDIYTTQAFDNRDRLQFRLTLNGGGSTNTLSLNRNQLLSLGFDHTLINTWQTLAIPISEFTNVDGILAWDELQIVRVRTPELVIDYIRYDGGEVVVEPPTTFDDYTISADLEETTGIVTFTRVSGDTFNVDLSGLVGNQTFIEGTYVEIRTIRDNNELIPGLTYIITDYQTEYFIEGSNSSGIIEEKEITSFTSGYAVLDNDYEYDLNIGDTVQITELPVGYVGPLNVGDTTTVTAEFSDYYFQFANGMQNQIGLKFEFTYDRYVGIAPDAIINDGGGRPVLQPQGLINTDVHDGAAYMDQSAAENLAVPVERIVLIASDTNSFFKEATSDTFQGDILEYDMDDDEIINDNNEVIGTRRGLVTRRMTFDGTIDLPIDWRVWRFRRWQLDVASRTSFLNQNELTTTLVGASGQYLFTSLQRSSGSAEAFYIAKLPEGVFMNLDANAQKQEFNYTVTSNITAKDFNIIELDSNYDAVNVDKCVIKGFFANTVIRDLAATINYGLFLDIDGTVTGNTFVSYFSTGQSTVKGRFTNSTYLDSGVFGFCDNIALDNVQALNYWGFNRMLSTTITNCIFGVLPAAINGMTSTNSWFTIRAAVSSEFTDSVIGMKNSYPRFNNTKVIKSALFLGDVNPTGGPGGNYNASVTPEVITANESVFYNTIIRFLASVDRISMNEMFFPDTNTVTGQPDNLFIYETTTLFTRVHLKLNRYDYRIYRMDVNADDEITIITMLNPA